MSRNLSIVLIGGTGFVGRAILRQISSQKLPYSNVHTLTRLDSQRIKIPGVQSLQGDLSSIPRGLYPSSPYVLLHFGTKQTDATGEGFWKDNVHGTQNLLSSLTDKCLGVIYGSSMSVYGQGDQINILENSVCSPGTALARSRFAAENCINKETKTRKISAISLRPRFILGEGDRYTIPGLFSLFRKNISIRDCQAKYSIIDVDDYASIILKLAEKIAGEHPRQLAMNVGLKNPLSFGSMENIVTDTLGIPRPQIRLPLGPTAIRISRRIPGRRASSLTTKLELLCQHHYGNIKRLESYIGDSITAQSPEKVTRHAAQKFITKVS